MRYSVLFLAALATAVTAQVPSCAQDCINTAVKELGICGATDVACQCKDANNKAISAAATPCVIKACGIDVGLKAQAAAAKVCADLAAAPPAPPAAPKPVATTPAGPKPAAATPVAAPAYSSAPADSGASTITVTVCSSSAPSASAAPIPSPVSNGTIGTNTPQPPAATFTGAATQMAAGMGSMVFAGVLALFL